MLVAVTAQKRDQSLAYEAMEFAGLADPENRDLAAQETMVFTALASPHALQGMTFEGDDVYFLEGWDRAMLPKQRESFLAALAAGGVDVNNPNVLRLPHAR